MVYLPTFSWVFSRDYGWDRGLRVRYEINDYKASFPRRVLNSYICPTKSLYKAFQLYNTHWEMFKSGFNGLTRIPEWWTKSMSKDQYFSAFMINHGTHPKEKWPPSHQEKKCHQSLVWQCCKESSLTFSPGWRVFESIHPVSSACLLHGSSTLNLENSAPRNTVEKYVMTKYLSINSMVNKKLRHKDMSCGATVRSSKTCVANTPTPTWPQTLD